MRRVINIASRQLRRLGAHSGRARYGVGALILLAVGLVPHLQVEPTADGHTYDCEAAADPRPALCTHGSQPFPEGVSPRKRPAIDELRKRGRMWSGEVATDGGNAEPIEAQAGWTIDCVGDGISGNRVQAIYARASDVPSRYKDVTPLIRGYAADVDQAISSAASATGGGRRVRYVTNNCVLDVANVTLSTTGDDSLGNTISELKSQGFSRTDRKYLVWVDAAVGICGIAQLYRDDRPTADNYNNRGPLFARVDAPCWGYAEGHELLHTLGAVQSSAPNATNAGHCTDERDTMCYVDGAGVTTVERCTQTPAWHVDCGYDDYFHSSPPAGSYLAGHWNTANSGWLEATTPIARPTVSIKASKSFYAGRAVTVSGVASDADGTIASVRWSSSRSDCRFAKPRALKSAFWCPATAAGSGSVTLTVTDNDGYKASASSTFALAVPAQPRKTAVGIARSTSVTTYGKSVKVTGRLTDAATSKPVIGMPVALYAKPAGKSWTKIATATTNASGRVGKTLKPASNTEYAWKSGRTSTWQSRQSATRAVGVRAAVTINPSTTTALPGTTVELRGSVAPKHAGQTVVLQRRTSTGWSKVKTATLYSTSTYRFKIQMPLTGKLVLRVVKPADGDHKVGASRPVEITIVP